MGNNTFQGRVKLGLGLRITSKFYKLSPQNEAITKEHEMTISEALKKYPKAIGWSLLISCAIIMEGYDVILMGSFYGLPAFNRKYGHLMTDGSYGLSAKWQAGLSNAVHCGQVAGLLASGILSERNGYRRTMIYALIATMAFIFVLFFAPNVQTLLVGEFLLGLPLGVYQSLCVTYASEVCPVALRAYLTTYVNLSWIIGQWLASAVIKGFSNRTDQWAYRIPFAIQWVWPIPILIGVYLAPESPWWLVRKGLHNEAVQCVRRLSKSNSSASAKQTIAMMTYTGEMESKVCSSTSYWDCFRGHDLRRTEISCLVWGVQILCGSGLMSYSTVFYQHAGLPVQQSFNMTLGQNALGFMGTILSWALMAYAGRRSIYVSGLGILCAVLLIIGFISIAPESSILSWVTGSMLLAFTFVYDCTVGPVCYTLVSEIPSARLRIKTVTVARSIYNIFDIVNSVIVPYMLNVDAWDWKGKSGFFWGGMALGCSIWAFFRVPEPKGRTYAEIDALFEKKVSARKFSSTRIELFTEGGGGTSLNKHDCHPLTA
ncbi:general substrate transporter [Aspergillus ambiguus]|uniref:MFS maltose permease MalP n=1 Tax=Aspergillus ambiguus TaxID=176160 RepID=UPI003CCDCB22